MNPFMTSAFKDAIGDDIIDTRDMWERVHDIESTWYDTDDPSRWDADDREDWEALHAVLKEIGATNHRDCVLLVHERYFRDHIRDEYHDAHMPQVYKNPFDYGQSPIRASKLYQMRPFNCIDWDALAEMERSEHSEITIEGHIYLYRSY